MSAPTDRVSQRAGRLGGPSPRSRRRARHDRLPGRRRPAPRTAPTPSGGASASRPADGRCRRTRTTFIVGIKQDIDSLNPFVGRRRRRRTRCTSSCTTRSTGTAPTDFSPQPALAESLGDVGGRQDLDVPHPRRACKWSDGQPLTAKDVGVHLQPGDERRDEHGQYGNYVSRSRR